jgi:phosphate transport system substrate-binding protein
LQARALIALLLVLPLAGCGGSGESTSLVGAGSTLVAPLVSQWASAYGKKTGAMITYGAIGSGGGIAQMTARTIDFGASDAPLTPNQASACKDCVQLPWALGATLLSYNLKRAPAKLKLSGPVLAGIYLGTIRHWNDPAITRLNPGSKLPATPVIPVYRSDGSGDSYAFSDFLAKVSTPWRSKEGVSPQLDLPTGIGGRGNDGVAAVLGRNNGAIGYLGISYVFRNKLDYALIRNQAGKFPVPGPDTITAAADAVRAIPPDNAMSLTNPPASAPNAYPISTLTYAIFPASSRKAKALSDFVTYAIGPGQAFGQKLQFAPLPEQVVSADKRTLARLG